MKIRIIIILMFLIILNILEAQDQAAFIPKMSNDIKTFDWYNHQAELWAKKLDKDINNEFAWLNYYKALRYAALVSTKSLSDRTAELQRLNPLIDAMATHISDSWVYHYCKWLQGGNDPKYFSDLQKAFDIRNDFGELSPDFVTYYEISGNREKRNYFINRWYESRSLAPDLFYFSYNVLRSLDSNSVIITGSDNDTYPLWILQVAKDNRKDVQIINTSLIALETYRDSLMKNYNLMYDKSQLSEDSLKVKPYYKACSRFIKSLVRLNPEKKFYMALTMDEDYRNEFFGELYVVGLAYRINTSKFDNFPLLEKNWENLHLDYLDFQVYNESYGFNKSWLPNLNLNYVTPAFSLFDFYMKKGKKVEAEKIKKFILQIGKEGGKEDAVKQYLDNVDKRK